MAENNDQLEVTPETDETDYKALYEKTLAESRKWENRSKANAEKAKKFDKLESANKTLEERVSEIENANKALEAEKARAQLVKTVADLTGTTGNVDNQIVTVFVFVDEFTNGRIKHFLTPREFCFYFVPPKIGRWQ